jgi:hypothetical protein
MLIQSSSINSSSSNHSEYKSKIPPASSLPRIPANLYKTATMAPYVCLIPPRSSRGLETTSYDSNNRSSPQQQTPPHAYEGTPPANEGPGVVVVIDDDDDEEEDVEEVVAGDQERELVSIPHPDPTPYDTDKVYRRPTRRTQMSFPGPLGGKPSTYEGLSSSLLSIPPREWLSCGWLKDVRLISYRGRRPNARSACTGCRT